MQNKIKRVAAAVGCFCGIVCVGIVYAHGFVTVDDKAWSETVVRKVLHVFAYGGFATDEQIKNWADMDPATAIREMLSFAAVNDKLSPVQDITAQYAGSLEELQYFWWSDDPDNPLCTSQRQVYAATNTRADGEVVLRNLGLQNTWIAAVNKRGLNPFGQMMGFWLTNYHMAVNLHDTEPP